MEKDGIVSFWIATTDNSEKVSRILEYEVTEDGDFMGCQFSRALKIGNYNPDYLEWKYFPKVISKMKLLFHSFSYSNVIIPRLESLVGMVIGNCCVALYNFEFENKCEEYEIYDIKFKYIGSVSWK